MTIAGLVVMLIATFAKSAEVNIDIEALNVTMATLVQIASVMAIYWGRFRQGDMNLFGFKANK